MYLNINNKIIDIKKATNFKTKLIGLMFKKNFKYGILFPNCNKIHTNFMFEPIDIVVLNENNQIIEIKRNLNPWHIFISKEKNKTSILELPNNASLPLSIDDCLLFK